MNKDQLLQEWNSIKGDRQFQLLSQLTDKNVDQIMTEALLLSQLNTIVHDAIYKLP